ncbi:hypothetical protein ACWEQL_14915 [Kitasatospora sp. NPDC004240]
MTAVLPTALAPWAATLAALTPELATALGPLLRRLDTLVTEDEPATDPGGAPDGHGGLTRSGRPDQLLPSEWLLAEEFPDEFLRRFVDRELLHLAPEFRAPAPRGRIVVLADNGPTTAGAGRLVQLAALLVLHRRAAARGTELRVGILGDPPGTWLGTDLADLLPAWLEARRGDDPTPADVAGAQREADAADQVWVLTSEQLAARLAADPSTSTAGPSTAGPSTAGAARRPRLLTARPSRWSEDGATHVTVRVGPTPGAASAAAAVELPLPATDIAVRALRGAGFRRVPPGVVELPGEVLGEARPAFTTRARTLLSRGRRPATLIAVNLTSGEARDTSVVRPRRHDLPGPLVAAGRNGRRLIALYVRGDELLPYVSGRPLGEPGAYRVDRATLGLDDALLDELLTLPPLPVLLEGTDLVCPLGGRWWRIGPDGDVRDEGRTVTGRDGRPFDRAREPRLYKGPLPPETASAVDLVHGGDALAWTYDRRAWYLRTRNGDHPRITIREDAEVVGVVHDLGEATLITCSRSGRMVRAVRATGVRTLSRFSGGTGRPAVHPLHPLIATTPSADRVVIGNAETGRVHHHIGSER